ncbi:MAG: hypothetical protein Q9170_000431 [Blastenia crenularia]
MESVTEVATRGIERKVAEALSESIKKARPSEKAFADARLIYSTSTPTRPISAAKPQDFEIDPDSGSNTELEDQSDRDSVVISTPLTPYSPNAPPRFPSELKTHLCTYANCGKAFNRPAKLAQHVLSHTNSRPFVSTDVTIKTAPEEGTAGFSTYAEMQEHIKSCHPPHCEVCGLICKSQHDLKKHMEVRHGPSSVDERRLYPCPEPGCGRAYTKKGNLMVHIQSAHMAKKYVCGEVQLGSLNRIDGWEGLNACGRALSTKGSLENHIRTVHMDMGRRRQKRPNKNRSDPAEEQHVHDINLSKLTGVGYEKCGGRHIVCSMPECGFRFGRGYDLQVHLISRHALPEHEAKEMIANADENFDRPIVHDGDFSNGLWRGIGCEDAQTMTPHGLGSIREEEIPYGGLFSLGDTLDEFHERNDYDWLEDEKEMQKLIDGDDSGVQGQHWPMVDPSLQ